MTYLATTRGTLMRGSELDDYGDEVGKLVAVAGWDDKPVAITERRREVFDPATGVRRTVRYLSGRVPANMPVQEGDALRDDATGVIYPIREVLDVPRNIGGMSSLSLDLKRVGEP